jgi:L-lactate permease
VVLGLRTLGGVWTADTTWPTLLLLGAAFTLAYTLASWLLLPALRADLQRLRAHLTPR